jgi:DNA invertase Pin-like site-specific DNA recombinase
MEMQQSKATHAALLGYARVSKADDQDTRPQIMALAATNGCRILEEKGSSGRWDRPELHRLLDRLGPGDVLVVWKLDRLSRSLKDLLLILDKVEKAGAGFRSLAALERAMVREATQTGLRAARAQGRGGGWRPKLTAPQQAEVLTTLRAWCSAVDIARIFGIPRTTISRIAGTATVKNA